KNIYLFILLAAIFNVGCKKDLDLNPLDKISDASYWKTSNDFKLFANDFYNGLQGAHNYTDLNSDIAFGSGPNSKSNGSYLAQSNSPVWDNSYKYIRSANYLLQKAE